jgi:hypothetical protein
MYRIGLIISILWTVGWIIFLYRWSNKGKPPIDIVNFLEERNDFETLYRLGEYNKNKEKEKQRVSAFSRISCLYKRGEETGIVEYIEYADYYKKVYFIFLFYIFCVLIGVIAFFTCIEMLS